MTHFRSQSGFSLIELMVAMSVLLILITIGVPNFSAFIKGSSLSSTTNMVVMDINFARSEAIKRGREVKLCRTSDPINATTCGGGTAKTWTSGWLIFTKDDFGNDVLLKRTEMTSAGITVMTNTDADSTLTFSSNGSKVGVSQGQFVICDDRDGDGDYDESYGRQIDISSTGRPGLTKGSSTTPLTSCTP